MNSSPVQLVSFLLIKEKAVLAEVRKSSDNFGAGAVWLPGGHVEKGESTLDAFVRELNEELGVVPIDYFELIQSPFVKDHKKYTIHYYAVTKWLGNIVNKEAAQLVWVSEKEVQKLSEAVDQKAFKKALQKINLV